MYAWAQNDAARWSHQVATADYDARLLNVLIIGFDDLHNAATSIDEQLDAIASATEVAEKAALDDEINRSVARSADADDLLGRLIAVRRSIDDARKLHQDLVTLPSRASFEQLGLHHVGRATLLTAFYELGQKAVASLSLKYSVFMTASIDNGGRVDAEVHVGDLGPVDAVAAALAESLPVVAILYLVVKIIFFFFSAGDCEKKLEAQRLKIREAFSLVKSRLLTPDDLYVLYSRTHQEKVATFKEHSEQFGKTIELLDKRWLELVALNAARNKTAEVILTAEKIGLIKKRAGTDSALKSILENTALSAVALDITAIHRTLAQQQVALMNACGDAPGFRLAEDHLDSIEYARELYSALRSRPAFVPLYDLLDSSLDDISNARHEALNVRQAWKTTPCNRRLIRTTGSLSATERKLRRQTANLVDRGGVRAAGANLRSSRTASHGYEVSPQMGFVTLSFPSGGSCALVTQDGRVYGCGRGEGSAYRRNFSHAAGNPILDILTRANDGGYATDNRRIELEVNKVNENLKQRVADLSEKSGAAARALPEWFTKNGEFLAGMRTETETGLQADIRAREVFIEVNAKSLGEARSLIDDFLASPFDSRRTSQFVSNLAGVDSSISTLRDDAIVPEFPAVTGFSAVERVYGIAVGFDRNLARERRKVERDLPRGSDLRSRATESIELAERFAKGGTDSGRRIAEQLLIDSASVRFAGSGTLKTPSSTSSDSDNRLARRDSAPTQQLSDTILQQAASFRNREAAFEIRAHAIATALMPDSSNYTRRLHVLRTAERAAVTAETTFYAGRMAEGSTLLDFAGLLLDLIVDLAIDVTPGIGWGRSVYEALSGRDLLTNEELTSIGYFAAVVGAVTGGLGKPAISAAKAARAIAEGVNKKYVDLAKLYGDKVLKIVKKQPEINAAELDFGPHMGKRMREFDLRDSDVERLINTGKPYLDVSIGDVDNAGLVYFAKRSEIVPSSTDRFLIGAAVDVDTNTVWTLLEEKRTLEQLETVLLPSSGKQRFHPLTQD